MPRLLGVNFRTTSRFNLLKVYIISIKKIQKGIDSFFGEGDNLFMFVFNFTNEYKRFREEEPYNILKILRKPVDGKHHGSEVFITRDDPNSSRARTRLSRASWTSLMSTPLRNDVEGPFKEHQNCGFLFSQKGDCTSMCLPMPSFLSDISILTTKNRKRGCLNIGSIVGSKINHLHLSSCFY